MEDTLKFWILTYRRYKHNNKPGEHRYAVTDPKQN